MLIVVVDALRMDHLSLYGYDRPTSPNLEALAGTGLAFENHLSHGSHTVPSTVSLMTSQLPAEHGYVHPHGGSFLKSPPVVRDELVLLAEVFRAAGYATAAFVANPFLKKKSRFDQGFDEYVFHPQDDPGGQDGPGGRRLNRLALEWLRLYDERRDGPFFVYLHYMDVHNPYEAPEGYRGRYPKPPRGRVVYRNGPSPDVDKRDLAATVAAYDEQIHLVDDLLRELLDELDRSRRRRDTIVVFTADHGDEFLEHGGLGHGTSVYGELLRVPLVISYPAGLDSGRRVGHRTQHLDLAPSLLELAGIDPPESFRGGSLFEPAETVFAEDGPWVAAYAAGGKLVVNTRGGIGRVFRDADPLDLAPIDDPQLESTLRGHLRSYLILRSAPRPAVTDPAARWTESETEQLRALGYAE